LASHDVTIIDAAEKSFTNERLFSYNKYLSVAARVVRRSLKEEQRVAAERRGVSELRSARWEVRTMLRPLV
jgi:hypothetical protein